MARVRAYPLILEVRPITTIIGPWQRLTLSTRQPQENDA